MIPFYQYRTDILLAEKCAGCLDFDSHLHISVELLYLRNGNMSVNIGGQEYVLNSGDVAVIFPNTVHSYKCLSNSESTVLTLIIFNQTSNNNLKKLFDNKISRTPVVKSENVHNNVVYSINSLIDIYNEGCDEYLTEQFLRIIFARLSPFMDIENASDSNPKDIPAKLMLYISEHFREDLSLEALAKEFSLSREYISRIFTKVIHIGFVQYINTMRIEYSQELLRTTDKDILSVAAESGFSSQQTFNRVFKELCHRTPAEYRKMLVQSCK